MGYCRVAEPLPVVGLQTARVSGGAGVEAWWSAGAGSTQDEYRVTYHEAGPSRDDSNALTVATTNVTLDALLPGRNYTLSVRTHCTLHTACVARHTSSSVATVVAAAVCERLRNSTLLRVAGDGGVPRGGVERERGVGGHGAARTRTALCCGTGPLAAARLAL